MEKERKDFCFCIARFNPVNVNIILHKKTSWTKDIYQPQKQLVFPFLTCLSNNIIYNLNTSIEYSQITLLSSREMALSAVSLQHKFIVKGQG